MVEMRWLERYVDDVMYSDIIVHPVRPIKRLERVLQFRTLVVDYCNVDGTVRVVYGSSWSEWQDVPVVREGEG